MSATVTVAELPRSTLDLQPGDILLHLIVTLLAPMFLAVCSGNLDFARMAALETVNAYRARSHVDLIAVAQIVAHGLASVSSACLSMSDDISLSMTLRLRASANASDRACDRARRTLEKNRAAPAPDPVFAPDPDPTPDLVPDPEADRKDAEVIARLAAVRQQGETLLARHAANRRADPPPPAAPIADQDPTPAPAIPTPEILTPEIPAQAISSQAASTPHGTAPAPAPPAPTEAEPSAQEFQQLWGNAMTVVANEYAARMADLPPAERDAARARAAVLTRAAGDLYSGNVPPRLRAGDLGSPNATKR